MEVRPLSEVLGAEVLGMDLSRPVAPEQGAALREAFLRYRVLCIRGEPLEPPAYVRAAQVFGRPKLQFASQYRHPAQPEIWVLAANGEQANRDVLGDGRPIVIGTHWHTDDSYLKVPAAATLLHGLTVPARGGDTRFADLYGAYEALPEALKRRIAALRALHVYRSSRAGARVAQVSATEAERAPPVSHPLVRTHPETGRRALYVNPNRIERIEGLPREESDALLDELYAHATAERFQYRHAWRRGDVVIWDNRCLLHAATADYTEPRLMHRILLEGTVPA